MATCEAIIRSALRRGGVIGKGVTPDPEQARIGLERLQGMFERMSNGLLGRVEDYYLDSGNYTAKEGQRIFKNSALGTVTISSTFTDEDTGQTRAPLDGALIVVVNRATSITNFWVYNAMIATWQDIKDLDLTDECPLSGQFEEALKDMLACLICDEIGLPIPPLVASNASLGKLSIATRPQTKPRSAKNKYF